MFKSNICNNFIYPIITPLKHLIHGFISFFLQDMRVPMSGSETARSRELFLCNEINELILTIFGSNR